MNRNGMLDAAGERGVVWDILVVGGGATGLGIAVDAATRGHRTLLVEKADFANATSSRSTKLIHGGVRYLQQGNLKLVREALHERALLLRHAPHLVHPIPFIIPNYSWLEGFFYGAGLKIYDLFAGSFRTGAGIGRSKHFSRQQTMEALPTLQAERLVGGTRYIDGQFDDARLAITLARTAADSGATLINYMSVVRLTKKNGHICGVITRDTESDREYELNARVIVNATGIFTDSIRRLDEPSAPDVISPSQGSHIVLPRRFLPGNAALMVPKTDDKRVLFAIPWHDRVLLGTTDTAMNEIVADPAPTQNEIEFLLEHAARYLSVAPQLSDILSTFAGLRPLVRSPRASNSALVPRDHSIFVSSSGLVTVTGGKWTTYRKMAEETVDRAVTIGGLAQRPCRTEELPLHGCIDEAKFAAPGSLSVHGSDTSQIRALAQQKPELNKPLHPNLPYIAAEVVWAARMEMARTVEDVLARRMRALFLDARASLAAAPIVARLLAQELRQDEKWVQKQTAHYEQLVRKYLPSAR